MKKEIKTKKDNEPIASKFINSPISIIIVLVLLVIGLLIYSRFLVKSSTLYNFYGYTEDFSFLGGTIFEGRTINNFGDSKVLYTGEDIELYDYELGYYIKNDEEYIPISVSRESNIVDDELKDKGASLKEVLMGVSFSFTESHKDAKYLSHENLSNLDSLVFRVYGKDAAGEIVDLEVPLNVEKLTK